MPAYAFTARTRAIFYLGNPPTTPNSKGVAFPILAEAAEKLQWQ
jgi:hypothetical protein